MHSQGEVAFVSRSPGRYRRWQFFLAHRGSQPQCTAILPTWAIVGSFNATLPVFVKHTFGWDPQGVGLIFLALTAPALAGAVFGAASDRYGPRNVALSGFSLASLSLALLALIRDDSVAAKADLLYSLLRWVGYFLTFCYRCGG